MTSEDAYLPSVLDTIDGKSIISLERSGGNVTFKNRHGDELGTFAIRNSINPTYTQALTTVGTFDAGYKRAIIKDWYRQFGQNEQIQNPQGLAKTWAMSSTSDFKYSAFCFNGSTGISIWKFGGDLSNFTRYSPTTVPTYQVNDLAWSPDGQYLAAGNNGTIALSEQPIWVYKRAGDALTKLTGGSGPQQFPSLQVDCVAWSPDGTYLAVGSRDGGGTLFVYKRSGDTFNRISTLNFPSPTQSGQPFSLSWSPGGTYLAIASKSTPFISILKRSGDVFTKLSDPPVVPVSAGLTIRWSPNGRYLAISSNKPTMPSSFYVLIYRRNGDSFSQHSAAYQAGRIRSIDWSPDNQYFVMGYDTAPYFSIYKVDALLNPIASSIPGFSFPIAAAQFSKDGRYLFCCAENGSGNSTAYIIKSQNGLVPGVLTNLTYDPET